MKLFRKSFFLVLYFFALTSFSDHQTQVIAKENANRFDAKAILVKLKSSDRIEAFHDFNDSIGVRIAKKFKIVPDLFLVVLPGNISVDGAIDFYQKLDTVEYAEPDFFARAIQSEQVPAQDDEFEIATNDLLYAQQWALENVGQSGGTVDDDINAPETWAIEVGTTTPVIGVVDSGVDYNHLDLNGNLWTNPLETPGNGIDDDGNGYIDDVYGVNAITGSGNPFDDYMHGTHVTGTIGAVGNNNLGISGVMQVADIASCKFLNSSGNGTSSDAIECLQYFSALKSRVSSPVNIVAINNSWTLSGKSQALQDAITTLRTKGILFVASSGNAGTNNDTAPTYPGNYPVANVISVAATDRFDVMPSFSNYGKKTVHLAAPGVSILSTFPSQSYGNLSGTSMAAPHVTGLIGLLASHSPSLTWSELKNLAISGGTVVPGLATTTMSSRRLRGADVLGLGSLTCSGQLVKARMEPFNTTIFVAKNATLPLKALNINCGSGNGNVTLYSSGPVNVVLADGGVNGDEAANDGIYSLNWVPTTVGTYALDYGNGDIVTVRVYDPSTWKGYNVAVDASFVSETITGTGVGAGNETLSTITSPFPIKIGGDTTGFTTLFVSSNGTISMLDPTIAPAVNRPIPTTVPTSVIAGFWDDLTFTQVGADIYYQTLGSAPNRRFVVEWRQFKHVSSPSTGTFQIIFYENNSNIRMAYKDTNLGNVTYDSGKSATVGVQLTSSLFTQYSYLLANAPTNRSLIWTLKP